jgi:hypothetical protein
MFLNRYARHGPTAITPPWGHFGQSWRTLGDPCQPTASHASGRSRRAAHHQAEGI